MLEEAGEYHEMTPGDQVVNDLISGLRFNYPKEAKPFGKQIEEKLSQLGLMGISDLRRLSGLGLYQGHRFDVSLAFTVIDEILHGENDSNSPDNRLARYLYEFPDKVEVFRQRWQNQRETAGLLTLPRFDQRFIPIEDQLAQYVDKRDQDLTTDVYEFFNRYPHLVKTLRQMMRKLQIGQTTAIDFGSPAGALLKQLVADSDLFNNGIGVDKLSLIDVLTHPMMRDLRAGGISVEPAEDSRILPAKEEILHDEVEKRTRILEVNNIALIQGDMFDPNLLQALLNGNNPKVAIAINSAFPHYTAEKISDWVDKLVQYRSVVLFLIGGRIPEFIPPHPSYRNRKIRGWHSYIYLAEDGKLTLAAHCVDSQKLPKGGLAKWYLK